MRCSALPSAPLLPLPHWSALSDQQPPLSPSRLSNWQAGDGRNQASRSKIEQASSRIDEKAEPGGISMRIRPKGVTFAPGATLDRSAA